MQNSNMQGDCCVCECITLFHHNSIKKLTEFTKEELQSFPLEYFIKHARPWELLQIWTKLPVNYRCDFKLQIRLPCYVHYNRPDWRTHWDGPVNSQEDCELCNQALRQIQL